MTLSVAERITRLCIPEPNSGCWLWLGVLDSKGYGRVGIVVNDAWVARFAHRVSWSEVNGNIPEGINVLHRCDVPCCVNPDHLFLGTQADNMNDMRAKGRHRFGIRPKGEQHRGSRLTEAQARYALSSPKRTVDIAKEIGVTYSCISTLRHGRSWKHLERT